MNNQLSIGFHEYQTAQDTNIVVNAYLTPQKRFDYTFYNHFHPYVGELVEQLNKKSIDGLLDVNFHASLVEDFFAAVYDPSTSFTVGVKHFPKEIDVSEQGPYAIYNWELLFHVPLTIAVHLSKNQRFAEAQRWFHYIFDPTSNDKDVPAPKRFWKFLRFRQATDVLQIDEMLHILSKPDSESTDAERALKELILSSYEAIRNNPFQPHVVARMRFLAYQYSVVMKYLDNLIAWGDSLFRQDTIETINEATQVYVLAANILGPRPQRIPPRGTVRPRTYAQLRAAGLDPLSNALVEMEGQFPFNLFLPQAEGVDTEQAHPLFGMGRTLYFCVPRNDKLLSYWDVVADRLFKIRHCMNIEGIVRQLPLFEPPIDPGMLVKAAAAGIDISSLVSGLNQPVVPVRAPLLIQKALELCGEVRNLGANLLAALEKQDGETLSRLRQQHEIAIQQLVQDVRFLQWKEAEESTEALLRSHVTALERYRHYKRLLGASEQDLPGRDSLTLDRAGLSSLNENTFDEIYDRLVGQYASLLETEDYPPLRLAGGGGDGALYLNLSENAELNEHAPLARDLRIAATVTDGIFGVLALLPLFKLDLHYWGIGGSMDLTGGQIFSGAGRIISGSINTAAAIQESLGASAGRTAGYERRVEDWVLQANVAALELVHVGRQIIGSLIREQITRHEYEVQQQQIEHAQEIDAFLQDKFTNQELYGWMQGELSRLYYEYYKFAFDIARKAEQTMKHEIMRPELDELSFVKFNYWDGGRKGLLSGEALHLDLKRLEMAYHDHNKREYELTRHISLRQLDPLALLALKATGSCEFMVPEWLYDLDTPGHYLRRIKSVSVSIPAVTGPYTSVNCTLSLLKSTLRRSPLLADGEYARQGSEDPRFADNFGTIQSIVTSGATNDSGLFETNLRDERRLPFEGAGAISHWQLELPAEFRQFDYNSISDVVLHVRYTARQGGGPLREGAVAHLQTLFEAAESSGLVHMISLPHDFPTEWHRFHAGDQDFQATIGMAHFPYFVQGREITITAAEMIALRERETVPTVPAGLDPGALTTGLADDSEAILTLAEDGDVLVRGDTAPVFVLLRYTVE